MTIVFGLTPLSLFYFSLFLLFEKWLKAVVGAMNCYHFLLVNVKGYFGFICFDLVCNHIE